MATSKAQELRRLMKQQKNEGRKVNHPFAKYNSLDQLLCCLCNHVLKSELLWNTHLQSKKHKESILRLKEKKSVHTEQNITQKRDYDHTSNSGHTSNSDQPQLKKSKTGDLPSDSFDNDKPTTPDTVQMKEVRGILKNSNKPPPQPPTIVATTAQTNAANKTDGLPSDFFDTSISKSHETEAEETIDKATEPNVSGNSKRKNSSTSEQLPEGFFDDPKQDAKARNIEYKDPQDEEWEKFQKMIQEETKISENIQDEEDEESEMLKDMDELNNMKTCLSRVDRLKNLVRKKKINNSKSIQPVKTEDVISKPSDDFEEEDLDDMESMFNWRAKMA